MAKVQKTSLSAYLSQNFTKSFLTLFLPLFFIGSLVFLIKISALTASIKINFVEMMTLFSYNLPFILFYTLPISFLVAIATTLLRLSNDNELIALFSLGTQAKGIMRQFFLIATLFSIVLLILSLGLMPKTKQQFNAFKQQKAAQAQVNISPSKLGQKFGNLFVYVESKTGDSMNNIVIYNIDKENSDQLFIAKKADIKNKNSIVTLTLENGSGYTFSDETLKKIDYEKMQVFQNLNAPPFTYNSIVAYWVKLSMIPKRKGRILFFIFLSLLPMIGLYIVGSFSIINPRYQKNYAYPILGLTTIGLYATATILEKQGNYYLTLGAIIGIYIFGRLLFKHYVSRYF